jgi:glutaredoxin-like YruB-family protein
MSKSVTVYSTPTCPYCHKVKQFLQSKGVQFTDVNVAADQEKAREVMEKTGRMAVPVVRIGEEFIVGYDADAIGKALGL